MKMSPSVLGSTGLFSLKNQDLKTLNKPEVRKVKRVLFGPVDQKATQDFLEKELKKIMVDKSGKWNFDFKTGRSLRPEGAFEWKVATPRKEVPPVRRELDVEMDISCQYCQLVDADLVRPRPRCFSHQSRITDFMKTTKRASARDVSKKQPSSDWTAEIPTKIPRLDIVS